jgi:hypothetical protein
MFQSRHVAPFSVLNLSLHLMALPLFIFLKVADVLAVQIERGILFAICQHCPVS